MIGETQEQFLGRIRAALGRTGDPPESEPSLPPPGDLEVSRVVARGEDLVARFLLSVEQAKMVPHRVADADSLARCIVQIAQAAGARSAIMPEEDWPGRDAVAAALGQAGVERLSADDRDAAFAADIGITGVEAGIAETGSMVLASGGGRRRLASLAVPIHIGVVQAAGIVPDLLDVWGQAPMPASAVLVSAPSKTADIELTLVMGVHGPRVEHVIVVG